MLAELLEGRSTAEAKAEAAELRKLIKSIPVNEQKLLQDAFEETKKEAATMMTAAREDQKKAEDKDDVDEYKWCQLYEREL